MALAYIISFTASGSTDCDHPCFADEATDPQTETLIRAHELPRGVAHVRPQLCRPPGTAPSSPSQASGHAPAAISWSDRRFPVLPIRDVTDTRSKEPHTYGLSDTQTCTRFQVRPRRATSRRFKLSVQSE